jgi:hypothetical protein
MENNTKNDLLLHIDKSKPVDEQVKEYVNALAMEKAVQSQELVNKLTETKKDQLESNAQADLKAEQTNLQRAEYDVYEGIATYAGIKTAGVVGAIIATLSEMLPSLILVLIVAKLLKKYSENFYVKSIIETLKPISCALLVSVAIGLIQPSINDLKSIGLLIFLLILSWRGKKDPLFYIIISGIIGILFLFI